MKPNFALTFSSEGLRLLQRAPTGWLLVGDVDYSAPDLAAGMAQLRAAAGRLSPEGVRTKLVLPNDQIKYLTVASTAKTEAEAEDDAAHALAGATPYALNELSFDWAMDDGQLFIAAVARDTLDEAEAFALEHDLGPVSFVALAEQSTFAGEPFFGVAKSARAEFGSADNVTRDLQPIHVVGRANIPEPEPEPAPMIEVVDDVPETPVDPAPPAPAKPKPVEAPKTEAKPPVEPAPKAPAAEPEAPAPVSFASVRAATPAPAPAGGKDAPKAPRKGKLTLTLPSAPDATPDPKPEPAKPAEPPKAAPKPQPAKPAKAKPAPFEPSVDVVGGKPRRLGLILTAILLIFMAGVALWASVFSDDGLAGLFGGAPEVQVASAPSPEAMTTATEEEMAEAADVEPAGDVTSGENAPPPSEAMLLPDPEPGLSREEAEQRYIATGIWQIAPDKPATPPALDSADAYLASIDPAINAVDAIALPDIGAQHDEPPSRRSNPAAAGTTYDVDQRGLVTATAEGALTPEGIKVFAGRPPLLPPRMPNRAEENQAVDPALSKLRPRPRPENLQEKTEREQLGGRTRTELALFRPRLRPEDVASEPQAETTTDDASTALAVASSLKPRLRPSSLASLANISRKSQPIVGGDDEEPEVTKAAPNLPSSASVARQATVKNAINLRELNLIGVYGKASDRRALVRLSNGRYKKVQVGDRIDGGQVAAISDTELRLVKNGRSVILKMPRG
ncbi:hypothetical protein E7681_14370 [Thalassobius vesicularis]|uniref:Translation initiation factor 2 n=1 Tax=Thalassobius vesicularis TaxID=1294297 RepID=A0A4S3M6C3_9RHOB|nr:hypothetical protein [Thalassobius vesicularis]THD72610.1 hypothetical protein E7681_14370 [Thalassobius vesicularis]